MSIYIFLGVIVVAIVGVAVYLNIQINRLNEELRHDRTHATLVNSSHMAQVEALVAENKRNSNDVDPNKMTIVVGDYVHELDSDILGTLFKINDVNWRIVKVSKTRETLPNNYPYTTGHNILECERVEK